MRNTDLLKQTLAEPKRPAQIPSDAQWLAGEGAGSWFYIESVSKENEFRIQRFSPHGHLECEGIFLLESRNTILDLNLAFKFAHLSHCAFVHIHQGHETIKLIRKVS
jgi:hypothetical protein